MCVRSVHLLHRPGVHGDLCPVTVLCGRALRWGVFITWPTFLLIILVLLPVVVAKHNCFASLLKLHVKKPCGDIVQNST